MTYELLKAPDGATIDMLTNSICELVPAPDSVKNRVWLEVEIEPKGYPQSNGYHCGEPIPTPEEFTNIGSYSIDTKNQNPRVDVIIKRNAPMTFDRNPPAYLTIDFKRSVSTIKIGKSQWNAIMNYSQASWKINNGHRGHQYIPLAMYITLYNDNPAHEKEVIKKALKEGIKLEIISFFDN